MNDTKDLTLWSIRNLMILDIDYFKKLVENKNKYKYLYEFLKNTITYHYKLYIDMMR